MRTIPVLQLIAWPLVFFLYRTVANNPRPTSNLFDSNEMPTYVNEKDDRLIDIQGPRSILEQQGNITEYADLNGRFVRESFEYFRHIEYRLETKQPFAHARWGDGEIRTAAGLDDFNYYRQATQQIDPEYSTALSQSLWTLAAHPLATVNVGMWFLQSKEKHRRFLKKAWNQVVPSFSQTNTSTQLGEYPYLFHESFYLPSGHPSIGETSTQLVGWIPLAQKAGYTIVLVGPSHLQGLPFLNVSAFVSTDGIEFDLAKTNAVTNQIQRLLTQHDNKQKPILFLISAGRSTKIIMADLLSQQPNNIHSFIDTGSSLDGYAGIQSRDYNDPLALCQNVPAPQRNYWMKPGVCDEAATKTLSPAQAKRQKRLQRREESNGGFNQLTT